ncbi:hypothetical protein [Nocardioides panzhihuensis]|uniref:Uncharacterized protein n=1 Tax=Nocardioides panzhihuensis TaxID=860243 RepID=A0A7Z0DS28_9ACTN|nr:hypothetical protein [Nocardioides panzhihuensis]NYI80311.1 hypothetical protein [Nocardioides panzhihuensis]
MNQAADGDSPIRANHEAMLAAGDGLVTDGETFDKTGKTMPGLDGLGPAALLISGVISSYADAGMRLSAEAQTIGDAVRVCSGELADADADSADALKILRQGMGE